MAATSGTQDLTITAYGAVERLLREVPFEFRFFQAVRLLERVMPERAPVGRFVSPSREVVRFAANPSSAFPASQIQTIQWRESAMPVMVVNFMGLTGPMGILPLYYTELIVERLRSKDRTFANFLDIFNHRLISLFYQAWEKYRFAIAYERGERDRFSHHLLDLIGLGTKGLQNRQAVPDDALLFYSGLLSLHARSAAGLRQLIWDYFDVPVEIEQLVGAWYKLDESTQCCFDKGNSYSEQLGVGAIVGDEIWDQQSGVRVRLGPLTLSQYLDFLPTGSAYQPLRGLLRFFAGDEIGFEAQLVLKRDEVPSCKLGDVTEQAPRLGWLSWTKTAPITRDPSDTILRV
ncbi:MAG TPA: type VI secretion system baseplate subunit TssG [Bryobacteraceae bacterium]|nr:type VI secretion system baseplate subunit TssG [Bryobacteraceae bacterium]